MKMRRCYFAGINCDKYARHFVTWMESGHRRINHSFLCDEHLPVYVDCFKKYPATYTDVKYQCVRAISSVG